MNSLSFIDKQITQFINTLIPHNPFFDAIFSFLSQKESSILLWIAIIIALVLFEFKKDRRFVVYFFAGTALTLFFNNFVLKKLFERHRPFEALVAVSDMCPKDFSFPSGHTSTAFAAAFILASFDKKRAFYYYILASLIGISRIYLGCHYVYDVVAGAAVGVLVGFLTTHYVKAAPKHAHGAGKRD